MRKVKKSENSWEKKNFNKTEIIKFKQLPPAPPEVFEEEKVKKEKWLWFEAPNNEEKERLKSSVNSSFNSTSTCMKNFEKPVPLDQNLIDES